MIIYRLTICKHVELPTHSGLMTADSEEQMHREASLWAHQGYLVTTEVLDD